MARAVRKNAPECQVEYIIDDSANSQMIDAAFGGVKINHPEIASTMATVSPKDDKLTVPLQMADLVAGLVKDVFLQWLSGGKPEYVPLEEKWHDHFELIGKWDKEHMLTGMADTLSDPRYGFFHGLLARKPLPQPTLKELKRKEKARRKALVRPN